MKKQDLLERDNLLEAEINRELTIVESLKQKTRDYSQLKGLTESLCLCLSFKDTAQTLTGEVNKLFDHPDTTVILYQFHFRTRELGICCSHKGQTQIQLKSKKGDIFDEFVVKTLQPLLVEDTRSDFRFDMEKGPPEESRTIRSLISVPLMIGHKILGILRLDSIHEDHFTMANLRFLTTIADLAAVAIENAQLYEHLEDLAVKDSLTGLYLRRCLMDRFPEELSRQLRAKRDLSLLMIDLDEFKKYNDEFGHTAGDIVLKTVGQLLKKTFRDAGDLVCRYGGEEFCVLLPDYPKEKAVHLAEAFRKKVERQAITLRRQDTKVTVSIGVATFPQDARLKEELIAKADEALYKAKKTGRNKVCGA